MQDSANGAVGAVSVSSLANSTIMLTINGAAKQLVVTPWITLLDLLRERLDLTGTKKAVITANVVRVRSW